MKESNINRIPVEGGSGKFPTGVVQFTNDWPGVFLRGDFCIFLKIELERLLSKASVGSSEFSVDKVESLLAMIETCLEDSKR